MVRLSKRRLRCLIREQMAKAQVPKDVQARIKNVADPGDREALEDAVQEVWAGERDISDLEDMLADIESGGGPEMMEATGMRLAPGTEKLSPWGDQAGEHFIVMEDLEEELKNTIANALEKGLIVDDLEDAWETAKQYVMGMEDY